MSYRSRFMPSLSDMAHSQPSTQQDSAARRRLVQNVLSQLSGPVDEAVPLLAWFGEDGGLHTQAVACLAVLGSESGCDIVLAQPRIARRQACVLFLTGGHVLQDLGDGEPTFVNGHPVPGAGHRLVHGDVIEVGTQPLAWIVPQPSATSARAGCAWPLPG